MKNILLAIICLAALAVADNLPGNASGASVSGTWFYQLTDGSIDTVNGYDSLGTGEQNVYGPFRTSYVDGGDVGSSVTFLAAGGYVASGDSGTVSISFGNGTSYSDTTSWAVIDTFTAAGLFANYSLSNVVAPSFWIKISNIDGTAIELQKESYIGLKE